MNWMTNWMMREGPGIPKNAPKKKGLALFFFVLFREAWDLFKLNVMLLVLSIPLVTIPAAFAAATRITVLMVQDENVYLWRDFWRAFRQYFRAATVAGLAFAAVLGLSGYAVYIYAQMARHNLAFAIPVAIGASVVIVTAMTASVYFVLMVRSEMRGAPLLKAALMAVLARPLPILGGLAVVAVLWVAHIIFYPASVFMPVVFNFSLGSLVMTFTAFRASDFALSLAGVTGPDHGANDPATAQMRN
ncbi:DUF624 domain-containing protein [Martelella alba]|uniref:DUF624 domain-containing protein n=1 Tax=Martelella alba TaxID=2590451 RepID=A0A506UDL7_9HYPH|nr:DUF624 domain-containing protein [Martelella alba]TPW31688.1 DUF624 domain-containing protein [Martelella alba]